jgi:hypothetical protein
MRILSLIQSRGSVGLKFEGETGGKYVLKPSVMGPVPVAQISYEVYP